MNDHQDAIDAVVGLKGVQRPRKYGAAVHILILLGNVGGAPLAPAGGDDESGDFTSAPPLGDEMP